MALYLGSNEQRVNLDGIVYCANLFSVLPTIEDIVLLSSDDHILKDLNGLYLMPKEDE